MKKIIIAIKKNWYITSIVVILLFSIVLRFAEYSNRWGLAYDQSHDVAVARYAVRNQKIPLVGPFSSGGPFQTGGEWYWLIMTGTLLNFGNIIAPWIFITLLYVLFVYAMIKAGEMFLDKKFGILIGILTSVSTAQITQSTNLTNQSPLSLTSLGAIYFAASFLRNRRQIFIFLAGFFVSLGTTIHLQGAALFPFILITIILARKDVLKSFFYAGFGIILPLVPLILFDIQNNFVNSMGFFQYIERDQFNISYELLGRRWLTYLFIFWPTAWGFIIGGYKYSGYLILGLFSLVVFFKVLRRDIPPFMWLLLSGLAVAVVIVRYTRTPLFDSYLVFLHPFIIILTAWVLYELIEYRRDIGICIGIVIISLSIVRSINEIKSSSNQLQYEIAAWKRFLKTRYPQDRFSIYDLGMKTRDKSVSLSIFLDAENMIDMEGRKIGVMFATTSAQLKKNNVVFGQMHTAQLVDLEEFAHEELVKNSWYPVNPENIYKSTQEWYQSNE